MKRITIPTGHPSPEQFKEARERAHLTQCQASRLIFGPDSSRTVQNWESGARKAPLGSFVLLLLMTQQITVRQAHAALLMEASILIEGLEEAVDKLPCYGQWFMADPEAEDCRDYLSEQCPACKLKETLLEKAK